MSSVGNTTAQLPTQGDSERRILLFFWGYGLPFFLLPCASLPPAHGHRLSVPLRQPARPPSARTLSRSSKSFCSANDQMSKKALLEDHTKPNKAYNSHPVCWNLCTVAACKAEGPRGRPHHGSSLQVQGLNYSKTVSLHCNHIAGHFVSSMTCHFIVNFL